MSEDQLWEDPGSSLFRPSYSPTWLNCLGSFHPSRQASDRAGIHAAIGTVFHMLMAEWQQTSRPDHWLDKIIPIFKEDQDVNEEPFEIQVDTDMFFYGQNCLDRYADIPGDRFVETKVDISSVTPIPDQSGTADLVICAPYILDVIDWKYGLGVKVFARYNTQLLLYGVGCFEKWDWMYHFKRIRLHIAQPRLEHFDVWEISREELIEWQAWAKDRAHGAWKRGAPRSPSPKACQWCKIRRDCAALEAARESIVDQTFDALDEPVTETQMKAVVARGSREPPVLPDPGALPTDQLERILKYRKLMEAWFSDIAGTLLQRAQEEGLSIWKVVEGRSKRQWIDEEKAADRLIAVGLAEDQVFELKIVSPAQAEKLLRPIGVRGNLLKLYMKTIAKKPPGKPTLAPDGDNRLSIPDMVDETFDGEEDDSL